MPVAQIVARPAVTGEDNSPARSTGRRRGRYGAREVLWRESELPRVKACGRSGHNLGGSIGVKVSAGQVAGFSGLSVCGSVWACPVCSAKIAATRQGEIAAAVTEFQRRGGTVVQLTLTMRHRRGQSLASLWDGLSYAWSAARSGRGWKEDQKQNGVVGWVRVVEVTNGCSGWHVHIHALLFCESTDTLFGEDSTAIGASMFQRWRDALLRKGFEAPLARQGGLDVKVLVGDAANLGDYFTKAVYSAGDRAGLETARGDLKEGRDCARCGTVHRQPFVILADVVRLGDADDLDAWHEWERASKGRRQLTWSRGLRSDLLAGAAELSDEAIADLDQGGDVVCVLPIESWREVRDRYGSVALLEAFELSIPEGFRWLDERGLAWSVPPGSSG